MGEARQKLMAKIDADACGIPRPREDQCPACQSRRVAIVPKTYFPADLRAHASIDCDLQFCLDCRAVWEPFPAVYVRDPVCAEPCDNCAFRPGAPEQADPEKWKALIDGLKPDGEGRFSGRFACHKGVPIDMTKGPGNFLFPQTSDGKFDTAKMRTCSGFLRMFWARLAKMETDHA